MQLLPILTLDCTVVVAAAGFGYSFEDETMLHARAPAEEHEHILLARELLDAREEYLVARDYCDTTDARML